MNEMLLRSLIQRKLDDGRLPHGGLPNIWGRPGDGVGCDACEKPVPGGLLTEGIEMTSHRRALQFHVPCFYLWDEMRKAPGR
jgi:hypothetical protein